jgi:hypothetical protein
VDLLVEFGAIGDDRDAGVGVVGEYPFSEEHHSDAFAAALGVPDDAALAIFDVGLGGFDAEVLVDAGEFLFACIEEDEVLEEIDEAGFGADFEQVFVEFVAAVVLFVFFPGEEVFFFGADRAVVQSFGVVSGEDELDGAEECADEFGLLVSEALADAVADRDAAVFEFDDADRDAVDVEDDVGAFFVFALNGDFFGDREVVGGGVLPVDQGDGFGEFTGGGFDLDAVVEQAVDGFVVFVEAAGGFVGFGAESVEGGADLGRGVALAGDVVGERFWVARSGLLMLSIGLLIYMA